MTSVIVAAHNESAVLNECLDRVKPSGAQIIVVANGCSDDTAEIARAAGVSVIERDEASKPRALNAGDAVATSFPRLYLDADVVLTPDAVRLIAAALAESGALAAVPRRELDLRGRPLLVRAYYAIHARLPASLNGLYSRGAIALSEQGRSRFERFPDMTADDLFLDSLFSLDERVVVSSVASLVRTPTQTRDLIRRLSRVRAGNATMRASSDQVRRSRRWSWFTDVVVKAPWLAPAAVGYLAITVIAAVQGRRQGDRRWARDDSSRVAT